VVRTTTSSERALERSRGVCAVEVTERDLAAEGVAEDGGDGGRGTRIGRGRGCGRGVGVGVGVARKRIRIRTERLI
jgi:hypothetical protein